MSNIDTEPPGLGDAGHEALKERHALAYHWSVRSDGRGAEQKRERVGVGQAEPSFNTSSAVLSLVQPQPQVETSFATAHHCSFWTAG